MIPKLKRLAIGSVVLLLVATVFMLITNTKSNPNTEVGTKDKTSTQTTSQTTITPAANITSKATQVGSSLLKEPLNMEVAKADFIVEVKINKFDELVWNTPDGIEPNSSNQIQYAAEPEQLTPVEISITTSYKGSLKGGQEVTLLLSGGPNSRPYGISKDFPKLGETKLWFLTKEENMRRGLGNTPLNSLSSLTFYTLQTDKSWVAPNGNKIVAISELQTALINPAPLPVRPALPSPVPQVKVGQALNVIEFYNLGNTQYIVVKSVSVNTVINDQAQIKNIIAILNTPISALPDSDISSAKDINSLVFIAFTLTNGKSVTMNYDLEAGEIRIIDSINPVKITAPSKFSEALGLK
jgi:hypothetical protein